MTSLIYLWMLGLAWWVVPEQIQPDAVFKSTEGSVTFISDAPLELITATSDALRGAIDTSRNTFAFTVTVNTFQGFNSPLQKQHFNENYMESERYPTATFTGKIIESVNYKIPGKVEVRAKGTLTIHGVRSEHIIRATLEVTPGALKVDGKFTVLLEDFNIRIPRILYQKISPEIQVKLDCTMKPSKKG